MTYYEQHKQDFLDGYFAFLRIPSVSTLPEHADDIRRAAEFVRDDLKTSGMENARLIEAPGRHPLVYADWLHAPDKPTLLLYGHYDVQPAEPLEEWHTPPFEPTIANNNVYARGACDDKGQVYILLKAVEGFLKTSGKLPINIKVLIEGEEEVGGEHIEAFVPANKELLKADAALVCDTEMFAAGLPTITTGLRGLVYGELTVNGARTDLHSGVYGGAAPNAIDAVAHIIASLKDAQGRFLIPGFTDNIRPPAPEERAAWASLPFREEEYLEKEVGSIALVGDPAIPVLERTWAQPTVEVHGIRGGFIGEGAKTVIPAKAVAKLSMRLVADQTPAEATAKLKSAIEKACPPGVTAKYEVIHSAPPSLVDPSNPFIKSAAAALTEVFGVETVYMRSGGSIPIVGLFLEHLGIASVMIGFGLPDDNLHAPNEKFHLPNFYNGIEAVAKYLERLGSN